MTETIEVVKFDLRQITGAFGTFIRATRNGLELSLLLVAAIARMRALATVRPRSMSSGALLWLLGWRGYYISSSTVTAMTSSEMSKLA
jgi:hypothetical protein